MSAERRKSCSETRRHAVPRTSQHWMVVTGSDGGEAALISRARSSAEAIVADESTR